MTGLVKEISCCQDTTEKDGKLRSHHDEKTIQQLIARMNRIEGQIRGIKGMIERRDYCDDVLNQISSARSALDGVSKLLLETHEIVRERTVRNWRHVGSGRSTKNSVSHDEIIIGHNK